MLRALSNYGCLVSRGGPVSTALEPESRGRASESGGPWGAPNFFAFRILPAVRPIGTRQIDADQAS